MPNLAPLLISTAAAAKLLSISPRTMWAIQKSGEIPVVRLGRLVRFDVEDLKTLIAERKRLDNRTQQYTNNNGRDPNGRFLRKE